MDPGARVRYPLTTPHFLPGVPVPITLVWVITNYIISTGNTELVAVRVVIYS